MAILTIRDFDEGLTAKLRARAAAHGRSMEAEARAILTSVLTKPTSGLGMGSRTRQRFADGEDGSFDPPQRVEQARAVEFPE
ncbi:FitA-like ribbon-helix-helix domain-containing protein [Labedaea rhizosphaerae]|uniref:Arc-like DNA binding dprotein n=1 Tax=Labedaea rhizosphaerae TaxID=598644 RepID=A0A4V3CZB1_LABRH|nr:Arc family DNA-binding protein [Labedaea rhizosphaerae]TDP97358.1 Arc-like DNA binding dprotein [Labedaea rhizosphaerae]